MIKLPRLMIISSDLMIIRSPATSEFMNDDYLTEIDD